MSVVLLDGWPLLYAPDSPAGLHLLALLEHLPGSIEAVLALPAPETGWFAALVEGLSHPALSLVRHQPSIENSPWGRLAWEQRILPNLARQKKAASLHTCGEAAPLFSKTPLTLSPAEFPGEHRPRGLAARLRQAAAQGGAVRARILWPADIPAQPAAQICPPFTSRLFNTQHTGSLLSLKGQPVDQPDGYVLYHGPGNEQALHTLLAGWSWVAGPVGEVYPLVALGLDEASRKRLAELAEAYQISESVRSLPALPPHSTAALYQGCTVLFHPARPAPWGDPLLHALACGKPVVSIESPEADRRMGAAAYLAPAENIRAQGAALLSVLVEESVREQLTTAALERSMAWGEVEDDLERLFS